MAKRIFNRTQTKARSEVTTALVYRLYGLTAEEIALVEGGL
ncbi:MAG: hypothetical protein SNJ55_13530 [Chloroherpetonaceae bacterium]